MFPDTVLKLGQKESTKGSAVQHLWTGDSQNSQILQGCEYFSHRRGQHMLGIKWMAGKTLFLRQDVAADDCLVNAQE